MNIFLMMSRDDVDSDDDLFFGRSRAEELSAVTVRELGRSSSSSSTSHTSYLSREPREFSCNFFFAGVNFYRFNAKNWQFTVYFAVIAQKIGNFLCILS